jgi:hypothetical protein
VPAPLSRSVGGDPFIAATDAAPREEIPTRRWVRHRDQRTTWWPEILVLVWLLWVYDAITNLAALRQRRALDHGAAILRLEERLHLDPERTLNHWLDHHHLLGLLAGDYYDNLHFIVTLGVVGWLWWRYPRHYRPLRTALVLVNVIGFGVYWLYPVAPPRLLPGQHFYDIVALTHALGGWHTGTLSKAANQFAAMPSLHLAWASWSALAVWIVVRGRRWAPLVWVYPVLTVVVVTATGNHYLTDCVAGVAATAVAAIIAFSVDRGLERRYAPQPAPRNMEGATTTPP